MRERAEEMMQDDGLLTVEQVAGLLQVPRTWVYKHIHKRAICRLPHIKLGKYVRFREREVLDFVERLRRV
jgi:excisionase family DNA binding protein